MSLGDTGKQPTTRKHRSDEETGASGVGERDRAPGSLPDIDGLVSTALSLATRRLYRDAAALLAVAQRLRGGDTQLRMLLHEVEALADVQPASTDTDGDSRETARRNAIDAAHFLGLAALYADRGKTAEALECIEMSKQKAPALPYAYKLHGRLLWRMQRYEAAAKELERAKRYNPFDAEVAELLGLVAYENRDFPEALGHTVDAFLLLDERATKAASRLRKRIRTLRKLLAWESRRFVELFHERHRLMTTAYDRLQWRRDQFLVERGLLDRGLLFSSSRSQEAHNRIALAGKLREAPQLQHLSDESVFQLTAVAREESKAAHVTLFPQSSSLRDLYLLERGEVTIKRRTPYGDFVRARLTGRDLLGAVNYIDGKGRSAEATTRSVCHVIRIDADGLDRLVDSQPDVGVQFHTCLWHVLAGRLRANNRQMETFVPEHESAPHDPVAAAAGNAAHVPRADKVRLFKEQGLSSRELLQLATFSTERHYPPETFLFREGDPGEEMFFVVDGSVRISRFIRGVGEEALAILGRGEFFGEMSLIDGEPRSADARTHDGPATVLTLHRDAVTQALAMDPGAAISFLRLLNRILAARLRELEEKLVLWQMLTMQQ